jgi:quinol monooxygenase YgiN
MAAPFIDRRAFESKMIETRDTFHLQGGTVRRSLVSALLGASLVACAGNQASPAVQSPPQAAAGSPSQTPTAESPPHGDSTTVTLVVTMTVKPEREQEFLKFAGKFVGDVHANEPGSLLCVLTRHPTRPNTFVWVERYRDAEALTAHGASAHFAEAKAKFPEFVAAPPEFLKLSQVLPE